MPISPSAASCGTSSAGNCCASIPLAHVRADLGLGELAHAAAQQLLLRGQTKVHRRSDSTIMDCMSTIATACALARSARDSALTARSSRVAARAGARRRHRVPRREHHAVQPAGEGIRRRRRPADRRRSSSNTPPTNEDVPALAPALKTGMGNVLLQTPLPIFGFQPYFTTGGGIYRETLGAHTETGFGIELGRRREDVAGGTAAAAGGLPGLQTGKRCAELASAPLLRRTESEVLTRLYFIESGDERQVDDAAGRLHAVGRASCRSCWSSATPKRFGEDLRACCSRCP